MKRLFIVLVMFFVGFITQAQEKKPQITFVTEEIDYGTIKKGTEARKVFEFTNTGEAPLIIVDFHSSCGCTVPNVPKNKPFAPGESGKIEVIYDSQRLGAIRKTITIITNASDTPIALRIKGKVIE